MTFTPRQAFQLYTIVSMNLLASVVMLLFAFYFYYRAKKTPILYAYLSILGLLILWTISKVFKTVSPNIGFRWFFVVTQYIGVQFLGLAILLFSMLYAGYHLPSKKWFIVLLIQPIIGFIIVVTNPLHMLFYSFFDYYRTRLGFLFLPTQFFLYLYIIIGLFLLLRQSFNPSFHRKKRIISRFFAICALLPMFVNFYYITFKFTDIPWIFPFPAFDVTPIAIAISFTLFVIPAIKYQFLDIVPLSYDHLYHFIDQGILITNTDQTINQINPLFQKTFPKFEIGKQLNDCIQQQFVDDRGNLNSLLSLLENDYSSKSTSPWIMPYLDHYYKWSISVIDEECYLFIFVDVTDLVHLQDKLNQTKENLISIHENLLQVHVREKELALIRARSAVSQNVHDILGHSLTVVIGTLELALLEIDAHAMQEKLCQAKELLLNSLSDLNDSLIHGASFHPPSLIEAISSMKLSGIHLDFSYQGQPYPLSPLQNEAIYRLCQEAITNAIKHGQASFIHIILRYDQKQIDLYAIDNGLGCKKITANLGLTGITNRFCHLGGNVVYGSGGEGGFHIHAQMPIGLNA